MIQDIVSTILIITGTLFVLLAAIGLVRMPDLFTRMSATTKASTLGISSLLLAVAVHFGDFGIISRSIAIIIFLMLTVPIAAHMIGRAAYFMDVPLKEGTKINELSGRYDPETHDLESHPCKSDDNECPPS